MKRKILFLCTGNSCRSQMAEGWAKSLLPEAIEAYSAGTAPHGLNPLAVRAMKESGIDISNYQSKTFESLGCVKFDLIVTVCDKAASSCPTPPSGTKVVHVPFDDPPKLAKTANNEEEAMPHYRRVRDEIKSFVTTIPALIGA